MIVFGVRNEEGQYLSPGGNGLYFAKPTRRISLFLKRKIAEGHLRGYRAKVVGFELVETCIEHEDCITHPVMGRVCLAGELAPSKTQEKLPT